MYVCVCVCAVGSLSSKSYHSKPTGLKQAGPKTVGGEKTVFTELHPDGDVRQVHQIIPQGRGSPDTVPDRGALHEEQNRTYQNG